MRLALSHLAYILKLKVSNTCQLWCVIIISFFLFLLYLFPLPPSHPLAVPVFVSPLLSNVNVLQFNDAQLRCTVTAEPQPTIQWFFGSQPVNLSRYSVGFYNGSQMREYYSVLSINSSMMSDTGDYTCVLANVHGPVNATAHVEVQGMYYFVSCYVCTRHDMLINVNQC